MAAIATAAMALSPGAAAYAADADATAPATTASANLRGAWNFENTAAGDREAANNGGSSSATAQLIGDDISIIADPAGVFGNVLHFGAGASSYMKINQYVNTGAGNASFAMWYRYDTTLDPTGDKPAVLLQQDGAGRSLLTLRPSNQYHTYVNATDVLSNNTVARGGWQHIAVSFDQTSRKVKFYVNGALDSEKNMGTSAVNAVTALLVGSHKNIGTMDPHSMKGDVDDIRVYDATLTDDQAAAIYAEQGTALVRKQLGTLVSQADALLAAGEVDAASAQAQALATAKRNAVNAMDNTSGSAAARMTAMNAAGTALQTAITAYQAHVPITRFHLRRQSSVRLQRVRQFRPRYDARERRLHRTVQAGRIRLDSLPRRHDFQPVQLEDHHRSARPTAQADARLLQQPRPGRHRTEFRHR